MKANIIHNWEKVWINKLKSIKKSEGLILSKLRKEYWFTVKQIKEFEEQGKLKFQLIWKTKYYSKDDLLNLL